MAAAADNTATFAVDLNAQGAKAGAESAAGSLEKLRDQIDEDTAALANMQKALKNLQGGTSVNIQAFQQLKKTIEAKKATIAQTQERFLQLGGTFRKGKKPVDDNADALKTLFERMQKGGGPIGGLAGQLSSLRGLLASGGALVVGAVAFVAVLAAVAGAALYAAAALVKYGIAAADAYRSERLQLEGLTKVRNWYGIAAGSAGDLQSAIDRVSDSSALGRDQIVGLGEGLYKAGLRGAAWEDALDGLTIAQSAAGAGQAAMYQSMIAGAGRSSAAVKRVTDDIRARFGGVAKAQMLSLTVQSKKLKESFDGLFRGLKLDGFLTALKSITDLFSQNTASGRALKQILEVVMQPLIDGFAVVAPFAEAFFLGMVIGAQKLVIAYYDVRLALKGAFGNTDLFKNIDSLTFALNLGKYAAYAMAAGVALLGAAFVVAIAPLAIISGLFFGVGFALASVVDKVFGAAKSIASINWLGLGASLVDGLVGGIMAGVGKVVGAVKNLANAAKNALKSALDSHSPSRVGIAIGKTLPQGGAIGIEADTPLVARAARKMASAAEDGAAPSMNALPRSSALSGGGAGGAVASAGGTTIAPIVNVNVTIAGGGRDGSDELEPMIRRVVGEEMPGAIRNAFTGVALTMGANV